MNETDAIYIASFLDEKFRVYGTSQRPIFKASEIAKFKCNHNYDASFCKSCWNEQV